MNSAVMQQAVLEWMAKVFPARLYRDRQQRCLRFFEEATELVQAFGLPEQQALNVLSYVYARPEGEPAQEVGGVGVTLLALCSTEEIDFNRELFTEFGRINEPDVIEKIQAKQASKPAAVGGKNADDFPFAPYAWQSVSDALPPTNISESWGMTSERVPVMVKGHDDWQVGKLISYEGVNYWRVEGFHGDFVVTHWKRLPSIGHPPEREK